MKILMVAPNPFFVDRGFSVRIYNQARGLADAGHEVLVTAYPAGREVDCARIVRVPPLPGYGAEALGARLSRLYLDAFLFPVTLCAALRFRPEVIHGHLHEGGAVGLAVARLLGVPALLDAQGGLASELKDRGTVTSGALLRAAEAVERFITLRSDFVVYSSPALEGPLGDRFGVPATRRAYLPDAVDTAPFDAPRPFSRAALGLPEGGRLGVYAGTLHRYYGTDLLLEALAIARGRLNGCRFLICGGPEPEKYREAASALGLSGLVYFAGRTPYADLPRYLAAADFAVAPKLSGSEGNQKILAYMAAGLPVVCFDTPANREMLGGLGDYAGGLDAAALAEKLVLAASRERESGPPAADLKARVASRYSLAAVTRGLVSVYYSIAGKGA